MRLALKISTHSLKCVTQRKPTENAIYLLSTNSLVSFLFLNWISSESRDKASDVHATTTTTWFSVITTKWSSKFRMNFFSGMTTRLVFCLFSIFFLNSIFKYEHTLHHAIRNKFMLVCVIYNFHVNTIICRLFLFSVKNLSQKR